MNRHGHTLKKGGDEGKSLSSSAAASALLLRPKRAAFEDATKHIRQQSAHELIKQEGKKKQTKGDCAFSPKKKKNGHRRLAAKRRRRRSLQEKDDRMKARSQAIIFAAEEKKVAQILGQILQHLNNQIEMQAKTIRQQQQRPSIEDEMTAWPSLLSSADEKKEDEQVWFDQLITQGQDDESWCLGLDNDFFADDESSTTTTTNQQTSLQENVDGIEMGSWYQHEAQSELVSSKNEEWKRKPDDDEDTDKKDEEEEITFNEGKEQEEDLLLLEAAYLFDPALGSPGQDSEDDQTEHRMATSCDGQDHPHHHHLHLHQHQHQHYHLDDDEMQSLWMPCDGCPWGEMVGEGQDFGDEQMVMSFFN